MRWTRRYLWGHIWYVLRQSFCMQYCHLFDFEQFTHTIFHWSRTRLGWRFFCVWKNSYLIMSHIETQAAAQSDHYFGGGESRPPPLRVRYQRLTSSCGLVLDKFYHGSNGMRVYRCSLRCKCPSHCVHATIRAESHQNVRMSSSTNCS